MELIYISICVLVITVSLYQLKFKKPIRNWLQKRKAAAQRKEELQKLVVLEKEKMLGGVKFTTEGAPEYSSDEIMRLTAKDWEEAQRYCPIFDRHRTEALRRTMYRRYYAHVDIVAEVRAEKILNGLQKAAREGARVSGGGGCYGY